jgi:hypothetical protein
VAATCAHARAAQVLKQAGPLCCLAGASTTACGLPSAWKASLSISTLGGLHADALAFLQRLRRIQGLLNHAIIAQGDVDRYFVMRRVSFIIAAAVDCQLASSL